MYEAPGVRISDTDIFVLQAVGVDRIGPKTLAPEIRQERLWDEYKGIPLHTLATIWSSPAPNLNEAYGHFNIAGFGI